MKLTVTVGGVLLAIVIALLAVVIVQNNAAAYDRKMAECAQEDNLVARYVCEDS